MSVTLKDLLSGGNTVLEAWVKCTYCGSSFRVSMAKVPRVSLKDEILHRIAEGGQ